MQGIVLLLLVVGACSRRPGAYVARQKGRSEVEGLLLGFLFGPLGVLVIALCTGHAPPGP